MVTDCYELFTSYLRTNLSVDNRKMIFDMSTNLPYTPFTYTDFSYECLRIAQIHGSFTDPYDLPLLRLVEELLRAFCGLLRIITSYYDVFMATVHDLLQVVTDNYEQLTC